MATISGSVSRQGNGAGEVIVALWKAERFTRPPKADGRLPDGPPDYGPIRTNAAPEGGADYRFRGVPAGDYIISIDGGERRQLIPVAVSTSGGRQGSTGASLTPDATRGHPLVGTWIAAQRPTSAAPAPLMQSAPTGVASTGDATIAADTDANGNGAIILTTRGVTRMVLTSAGQLDLFALLRISDSGGAGGTSDLIQIVRPDGSASFVWKAGGLARLHFDVTPLSAVAVTQQQTARTAARAAGNAIGFGNWGILKFAGGASSSQPIINFEVNGVDAALIDTSPAGTETSPRFRLRGDGRIEWGPGTAPSDVTLFREGAAILRTNAQFQAASLRLGMAGLTFADGTTMTTASGGGGGSALSSTSDIALAADTDANGSGAILFSTANKERARISGHNLVMNAQSGSVPFRLGVGRQAGGAFEDHVIALTYNRRIDSATAGERDDPSKPMSSLALESYFNGLCEVNLDLQAPGAASAFRPFGLAATYDNSVVQMVVGANPAGAGGAELIGGMSPPALLRLTERNGAAASEDLIRIMRPDGTASFVWRAGGTPRLMFDLTGLATARIAAEQRPQPSAAARTTNAIGFGNWGILKFQGAPPSQPIINFEDGGADAVLIDSYPGAADTQPRFRLRGDGRVEWGIGGVATDANLYRRTARTLKTDSQLESAVALVTGVKAGAPTDADLRSAVDGAIVVDSINRRLYVRVGGAWRYAALT